MSVWLHGRAIRRAVAGALSERAERRLRAHLRGCEACRAHYDELARIAETLAATRGEIGTVDGEAGISASNGSAPVPVSGTLSAAARERARLMAALPSSEDARAGGVAAAGAPPPRTARARRPVWAAALLVPAAAALWLVVRPVSAPPPSVRPDGGVASVAWRGSPSGDDAAPSATLLVFASRKVGGGPGDGGPARSRARTSATSKSPSIDAAPVPHVRLVADLPASGEGRVSRDDFVQFVLRGLQAKAFVTVIGIDDAGEVHTYVPPAGGAVSGHEPSASSISLGSSVDLGAGHRTGRLRLYALMPAAPLDPARIRAAAARIDLTRPGAPPLDLPVPQVAGVLTIGP